MRLFSSQSGGGARLLVFSGGRGGYLFLKSSPFDEALGLLRREEGLGSWSFQSGGGAIFFSSPALSMRLLVFSGGRRGYLFLKFTSFDEALGLLSWEEGLGSWSSQAGGGARLLVFSGGRRGRLLVFSRQEEGLSFLKSSPFDEALGLLRWEEGLSFSQVHLF